MKKELGRYFSAGLFGLALIASGCAARGVDVRAPIDAQSTVEGDSATSRGRGSSATTGTQTDRSTTTTGDRSGSGSVGR